MRDPVRGRASLSKIAPMSQESEMDVTDIVRKVIARADQEAKRFCHDCIGPEHLLLGLMKELDVLTALILKDFDVDRRKVRMEVEKLLSSGRDLVTLGRLPLSDETKSVIKFAAEEARNLRHASVGGQSLLLGLLRDDGIAGQVLFRAGLEPEGVREKIRRQIQVKKITLSPIDELLDDFVRRHSRSRGFRRETTYKFIYSPNAAGEIECVRKKIREKEFQDVAVPERRTSPERAVASDGPKQVDFILPPRGRPLGVDGVLQAFFNDGRVNMDEPIDGKAFLKTVEQWMEESRRNLESAGKILMAMAKGFAAPEPPGNSLPVSQMMGEGDGD